jgi:hypothetical protein
MATQLRDLDNDLVTRWHLAIGLESLREQFAGTFLSETIERYLVESVEGLSGARPVRSAGSTLADEINPDAP